MPLLTSDVSEVLFQAETTATLASTSDGMSTREYVVIGVCSLLLGLIYVSSVFLYIHMKKRKTRDQSHRRNSIDDLANEINYPKNDQVTFGAPFNRSGSIYSATSLGTSNEPRSRASIGSLKDDIGIIKNNPLLQHYPQLSDHHSGFASDISNSNSECELDASFHDKIKHLQTSVLVHPQSSGGNVSPKTMQTNNHNNNSNNNAKGNEDSTDAGGAAAQDNECIPMENVSIVEDMMTEEKLENLRAMVNGNVRKKLYFNPAYFEPHLLMQPPAAAIEFLQKIREVIAIAKYKMATKRFQPSLAHIPEETTVRSETSSIYGGGAPGATTAAVSLPSSECQGCATKRCSGHVKNCGDKRNSIEKWLETVTEGEKPQPQAQTQNAKESSPKAEEVIPKPVATANRISPRKDISPPKQRPPPPPTPKPNKPPSANNNQVSVVKQQVEQRISIPVKSCYESYAGLASAVTAYGFAGELYNNPKFYLHDSPNASQRSRGSSHRSKSPKKKLDALEQYATASTPTSLNSMDRQHYNMLRNMHKQQQSIGMEPQYDYNGSLKSNASFHLNIPTPDYDSTMEKKIRDIYNNTTSSGPSVPTPDYSTLSRKSLRQYQPPDSPIYRRKSPQYLIVDYETDSLERLDATKRKSSHSSSSPSSDVSSQLSPSLSTALPLEEEMEISHTVYDKNDGFRKDGDAKRKLSKSNSNNAPTQQKEAATRIKYDTPFRGSMTIEVEHEPQSDLERSTDSDQFEQDTLDRKPKKQSFCDVNAWSGYLKNSPLIHHHARDTSSPQFESLPPTYTNVHRDSFILRNRSNSFHNQMDITPTRPPKSPANGIADEATVSNFGSLRDIYETQAQLSRQSSQSSSCRCGSQIKAKHAYDNMHSSEQQGRLLTLEAKHTRRQQQVEAPVPPPPQVVEIANVVPNKTTIKISTPKEVRCTNEQVNGNNKYQATSAKSSNNFYDEAKNYESSTPSSTRHAPVSKSKYPARSPPPPPPTHQPMPFSSTTMSSQKSQASNGRNNFNNLTEDDSVSNVSESTEFTRVSDNLANSEFNGSCQNTLETHGIEKSIKETIKEIPLEECKPDKIITEIVMKIESPISPKKIHNEKDFGSIFNAKLTGLRNDYSLTKYLNRRKNPGEGDDGNEDDKSSSYELDAQMEANNNLKNLDADANILDVLSVSSRSNRSSSRLSDRTKEMYRNAGVPVGIAYPQRSSVSNASSQPSSNTVQTVYRCEIEPVQLTHGMQVAMGLKDRAKKAKDLKNAWKKFVSMAASKFSPTQSPAPPFEKKTSHILEAIERDEGISSLIDEHPQVSTPQSSFSAPTQQNYYEQRFGNRLPELDSGYMSADSGEVYRRSFYDRYNFKMRSGRDQIIRVDTIEDHSEGGSVVYNGPGITSRRNSLIDSQRFEDLEHMGEPPQHELHLNEGALSDADSDKTITDERRRNMGRTACANIYSSEDEHEHNRSYGSSETDGETNGEDMWESGAESIETHSVLYKNIRNH